MVDKTERSKKMTEKPEKAICKLIRQEEAKLRQKYSILQQQDFLGAFIFVFSLIMIAATWYAYYYFQLSAFWTIVLIALPTSLLHELEHDLIHNLYFRRQSYIQDIMFFVIWVAKLHGNPWFRRELHLKHHLVSGQEDDAEERLIGLGYAQPVCMFHLK